MKGKCTVTIVFVIDIDTDHYEGTATVAEAIEQQREFFEDGTADVVEALQYASDVTIELEEVAE